MRDHKSNLYGLYLVSVVKAQVRAARPARATAEGRQARPTPRQGRCRQRAATLGAPPRHVLPLPPSAGYSHSRGSPACSCMPATASRSRARPPVSPPLPPAPVQRQQVRARARPPVSPPLPPAPVQRQQVRARRARRRGVATGSAGPARLPAGKERRPRKHAGPQAEDRHRLGGRGAGTLRGFRIWESRVGADARGPWRQGELSTPGSPGSGRTRCPGPQAGSGLVGAQ